LFLIFRFVGGICVHYGNEGYPSVRDGDLLVYSFLEKDWKQGELILYQDGERIRCGRIVACGPAEVDITNQGVLVDGNISLDRIPYQTLPESAETDLPLTLDEEEYYVLHDYRPDAADSRKSGAVKKDAIVGRIVLIVRWRGF